MPQVADRTGLQRVVDHPGAVVGSVATLGSARSRAREGKSSLCALYRIISPSPARKAGLRSDTNRGPLGSVLRCCKGMKITRGRADPPSWSDRVVRGSPRLRRHRDSTARDGLRAFWERVEHPRTTQWWRGGG